MKCVKMRKVHDLISADDAITEGLISHSCSYGIRLASRELLAGKKKGKLKDLVDEEDEYTEAFEDEEIIKTLSITSEGVTKIFPLMKERANSASKEISDVRLIKKEEHTMRFSLEQPPGEPEEVLEAFYTSNHDF